MTLVKNPIIYRNPKTALNNVLHVLYNMIWNCNINRKLTHHSGLQTTKKVKLQWETELLKLYLYVSHLIKKVNDFQMPDFQYELYDSYFIIESECYTLQMSKKKF